MKNSTTQLPINLTSVALVFINSVKTRLILFLLLVCAFNSKAQQLIPLYDKVPNSIDSKIEENNVGKQEYITILNRKGSTIAYSPSSSVKIIKIHGLFFKDLNKNGKLDKYEDWRLTIDERARDLASKMSIDQIAGLMLYSSSQFIETDTLSNDQKKILKDNNVRHFTISTVKSPKTAAEWSNSVQSFVEGLSLGVPANNSSDPRHNTQGTEGINDGSGGKISIWPEELGFAATFDPQIVRSFGRIAAREYRALGLTTALSPQVDLATEPRWFRLPGTFGENPYLAADMSKAYIDGFQTSIGKDEIKNGWGYTSVNCMVKHWPGGGPVEGGRDAHFSFGKYAVYPGNNFQMHLIPFINGAFHLNGKTKKAAAVMPYYTISYNQDTIYSENVGNSYSKYIITDLLRNKYSYDGVVCTDWFITTGKKWGVEKSSVPERFFKAIMAGVDQFGGVIDPKLLLEAYQMGVKLHGETLMRQRFELSAIRLLRNIFQVGSFENPYINPTLSENIVGNPQFVKDGYNAQIKSIVLLKNKDHILPIKKNKIVYIPKIFSPASKNPMGKVIPEKNDYPINIELVKKYFTVTDDPSLADVALVFVKGPNSGLGFDNTTGYVPISLQYSPYLADSARKNSIASDNPADASTDRSYKGKSINTSNYNDLKAILDTKKLMGDKPVIISMELSNPAIVSEFESKIQGLVVSFGVQPQAILDIISGKFEPSGLLPIQMPANMETVEKQKEDVPRDMKCHIDSEGHVYDFGYGLSWKGVIKDYRTEKYSFKTK